mgnify:CR=1 FL=1
MLRSEERARLEGWRFQSPETAGFHEVIVPGKADCSAISVDRLNLPAGKGFDLRTGSQEMHPVLISGKARLSGAPFGGQEMKRFDSFYLPAEASVRIDAVEDCVFYIAGAHFDGIGAPSFRAYDANLPIGDIHQIHGAGAGRREVMFTLDTATPASRLICGLTWGGLGTWTSWPPHQHEHDLEEAYCYFDMPAPKFGFHLSYLKSGETEDTVVHQVHSGTMVIAPRGYHPTVASPSVQNTYFWALASFRPESRRYDLAILDPAFANS